MGQIKYHIELWINDIRDCALCLIVWDYEMKKC